MRSLFGPILLCISSVLFVLSTVGLTQMQGYCRMLLNNYFVIKIYGKVSWFAVQINKPNLLAFLPFFIVFRSRGQLFNFQVDPWRLILHPSFVNFFSIYLLDT